jgi:hypothetical protein
VPGSSFLNCFAGQRPFNILNGDNAQCRYHPLSDLPIGQALVCISRIPKRMPAGLLLLQPYGEPQVTTLFKQHLMLFETLNTVALSARMLEQVMAQEF